MLLPPPVQRVASSGPGLAVVFIGLAAFQYGFEWWLSSSTVLTGAWIAIRGYRMAVTCDGWSITVRGQLHTQKIAKGDISAIHTNIDGLPAILWRRPGGRKRWSPILAFSGSKRDLSHFHERKIEQLERIRRWYKHDRPQRQSP